MSTQSKTKLSKMMEALVKLINNRKLDVNYTEYNFTAQNLLKKLAALDMIFLKNSMRLYVMQLLLKKIQRSFLR